MKNWSEKKKLFFCGIVLAGLALLPSYALADACDDPFADSKPYVFTILDISSSMTDTPLGVDTPTSSDDPSSKLYLAKRAIYECVQDLGASILHGFATFDRERMEVYRKLWAYKPVNPPSFFDTVPIFPVGQPVIFGEPLHRQSKEVGDGGGQNLTAIDHVNKTYTHRTCKKPTSFEEKVNDFPKLGPEGDYTTIFYCENDPTSREYKITLLPLEPPNRIGDWSFEARVRVEERVGDCDDEETENIYLQLFEETVAFERFYENDGDAGRPLPFPSTTDYLGFERSGTGALLYSSSYHSGSACHASGLQDPHDPDYKKSHRWEGNYDSDLALGDSLSYDVIPDPLGRGRELSRGDMIPWDWRDDAYPTANWEEILLRMAPNLSIGETVPDLRIARYFEDVPVGGRLPLKPEFANRPPIMSAKGSPIAGSLGSFMRWYDEWKVRAEDPVTGDPHFACRNKAVILLTDGAESCESGSLDDPLSDRRRLPAEAAAALYERGIRTFVIGFGASPSELASLEDIVNEGGTGAGIDADNDGIYEDPGRDKDGDGKPDGPGLINPKHKGELVDALLEIFLPIGPSSH